MGRRQRPLAGATQDGTAIAPGATAATLVGVGSRQVRGTGPAPGAGSKRALALTLASKSLANAEPPEQKRPAEWPFPYLGSGGPGGIRTHDSRIKSPPAVGPDVWATSRYGETVLERLSSAESPRRVPDTC